MTSSRSPLRARHSSFARAAMLGLMTAAQFSCTPVTDGDGAGGTGGESGDPNGAGSSGGAGGAEGVTSSQVIPDLSYIEFLGMCQEAGGVVETHSHCGGLVTGPGFSYDSDIDVLTEHTCAGYNTCTGFSCVIDE